MMIRLRVFKFIWQLDASFLISSVDILRLKYITNLVMLLIESYNGLEMTRRVLVWSSLNQV
jgi:hypothetical protein